MAGLPGERRSGPPAAAGPAGSGGAVRLTYLVKQLEQRSRAELDGLMRAHGLTIAQYTALSVLARHPGLSSAQLSRRAFVSPQAGNEMVATLERRGLLERAADPANRRVLLARLTPAGQAMVADCDVLVDALEARVFAGFTPAQLRALRTSLERWLLAGTGGAPTGTDPSVPGGR